MVFRAINGKPFVRSIKTAYSARSIIDEPNVPQQPTDAQTSLLQWWAEAGVDVQVLPPATQSDLPPASKSDKSAATNSPNPTTGSKPTNKRKAEARKLASTAENLSQLVTVITNFDAGSLSRSAKQAVIARGNPQAKIMLIGEAPGREEDAQGKPFIGQAGQFLDKMFGAIGLDESNLYITNSVFWRPAGNRTPTPDEIEICLPFLERHIALIAPKILIAIGGSSTKTLLATDTGISRLRGQWSQYTIKNPDGSDSETKIPLLPFYHPAFVLRKPATKKDCWNDLLSLQEMLENT